MQKDFKIGLIVGLVFVGVVGLWLATRPYLSPQARMEQSQRTNALDENRSQPLGYPADAATEQPTVLITPQTQPSPSDSAGYSSTVAPRETMSPQTAADTSDTAIYHRPQMPKTPRVYIVQRGDNLSTISEHYYGSPNRWRKILDANRQVVRDADFIMPGMRLVIPD